MTTSVDEYIESAARKFKKTPYWNSLYQNAPSERSRQYLDMICAMAWTAYERTDYGYRHICVFQDRMNQAMAAFDVDDWVYLKSWHPHLSTRWLCVRKILEIKAYEKLGWLIGG